MFRQHVRKVITNNKEMINMGAIVSFGGRVLQTACAFIVADALLTGASKAISSVKGMVTSKSTSPKPAAKNAVRPKKTT